MHIFLVKFQELSSKLHLVCCHIILSLNNGGTEEYGATDILAILDLNLLNSSDGLSWNSYYLGLTSIE